MSLAVLVLAPAGPSARQAGTRTIYVTVSDGKPAPVVDMTAEDFVVQEDGKPRAIVSAAAATTPMQIALMLDDSGLWLNSIRQSAGQLVQALQGKAEFALITTGGRNLTAVDFTRDLSKVYGGLQTLYMRNTQTGMYFLDGLLEVSEAFTKREAPRPVIVAIAAEREEFSNVRSEVVLDALQKSRAMLYYMSLGRPIVEGTRAPFSAERNTDDTTSEATNRNVVLGSGPKNSGGRAEQALQPEGIPRLMKVFADELLGQYAITYTTDLPTAKLTVETTRRGIKLRAPARVGSR